jgi:hypothetical protein
MNFLFTKHTNWKKKKLFSIIIKKRMKRLTPRRRNSTRQRKRLTPPRRRNSTRQRKRSVRKSTPRRIKQLGGDKKGVLNFLIGDTYIKYEFNPDTTFEDLVKFAIDEAESRGNLFNVLMSHGRRLSEKNFQTPDDWKYYSSVTINIITYPKLDTPEKLTQYILSFNCGIENISPAKPMASLCSGTMPGIVLSNIKKFFSPKDIEKYLSLLSTEKSGPITTTDNYYIYYSEKYIKLLAIAAELTVNTLFKKLTMNVHPSDDENMSLIYIAYGDITGLSHGFRVFKDDLTLRGRLIFKRYNELVKQNI